MKHAWKNLVAALRIGLLTILAAAAPAFAADKLHLKDGRVIEGEITKEIDGAVWFTWSVGDVRKTDLFTSDQIKKIDRDVEEAADATKTPATTEPAPAPDDADADGEEDQTTDSAAKGTRVVFVSLEEMVGPLLNADALKKSIELVEDQDPEVIVLVINSGGGALLEVEPLSDLIHNELKKDYRVVGWIRSAISAASLTVFNCEEIYMMTSGNVGGTVAFTQTSGGTKAASGADLEQILLLGEKISKRGKRSPLIMRAMQVFMDLSADIDENGNVTWYEGLQGKYVVNTKDRILTFTSPDALKFGVSKGTADTKDELMKAMGIREWVEIGPQADKYQREFRKAGQEFEAQSGKMNAEYTQAMQRAAGAGTPEEKARWVNKARQVLNQLRGLVRRAPSLEKYRGFTKEWFEEREEELRKLLSPG